MIKYADLVAYIKENHINWNTDLFDVLRDFFQNYSSPIPSDPPIQQEIIFSTEEFIEPENGEYSTEDILKLLSQ